MPLARYARCAAIMNCCYARYARSAAIITAPSEYVSNVVYLPLTADICNNVLQKQWSSSEFPMTIISM